MQPEKAIIFGPIIIFFGFFALLAFGFLGLVIKLIMKGKNASWKGVIVDKVHNSKRNEDNKLENFYSLVIKTEVGKEIKLGVSASQFEDYKIGDKLDKIKGDIWPTKVQ